VTIQGFRIARTAGIAIAALLVATACSSSSGGGGTSASVPAGGGAASSSGGAVSSSAPAPSAAGSSDDNGGGGGATNAAGKVELETQSSSLGTIITDSNGRTVYMFASDTPTSSSCSGPCLQFWPPVLTNGKTEASHGLAQNKITTLKRTDGGTQVVYNGRPLYYFSQDSGKGDVKGQRRTDFNSIWYVLSPAGAPIKKSA
jgi:predicted lipoprotein with Yx(FWY)xxD motif